jgi:hypothetical protein
MSIYTFFDYGVTIPKVEMLPQSIYLDGVVRGPVFNHEHRIYSFDHHAGCTRLITLSTCQQALTALTLGFDPDGFDVYLNDIDADGVLALWLLRDAADRKQLTELEARRVEEAVALIGFVDSHGPIKEPHPLHLALEPPYGVVQTETMLREYLDKVDLWLESGEIVQNDFPEVKCFGYTDEGVFIAKSAWDLSVLYAAGAVVGIIAVPGEDGTTGWTIGKRSDFVSYDIGAFLYRANELEEGWGGGSTIGGAPRNENGVRSRLTYEQVRRLLEAGLD